MGWAESYSEGEPRGRQHPQTGQHCCQGMVIFPLLLWFVLWLFSHWEASIIWYLYAPRELLDQESSICWRNTKHLNTARANQVEVTRTSMRRKLQLLHEYSLPQGFLRPTTGLIWRALDVDHELQIGAERTESDTEVPVSQIRIRNNFILKKT